MNRTISVENYLKAIYVLSERGETASTNAIAERLSTKAPSVTDMVRKLAEQGLVVHEKYRGVELTTEGRLIALNIIRKHRLWEVFLVEQLGFGWDEVHEIAEQLEHIQSPELIRKLDEFLNHPRFDPHGDPIPDEHGAMIKQRSGPLSELTEGEGGTIVGVSDASVSFLKYLDEKLLGIGTAVLVIRRHDFDNSMEITANSGQRFSISAAVARNIQIKA
jgi:DtxR family Mn-dependent transcriptional regulator